MFYGKAKFIKPKETSLIFIMFFSAIETFDDALLFTFNFVNFFIPITSIAVVILFISFLIFYENFVFYNTSSLKIFSKSI